MLRSGLSRKQAETALQALLLTGEVTQMTKDPRIFLARLAVENLKQLLLNELAEYQAANPLKAGIGKEELKTRIPRRSDQRFFAPLLSELEKESRLIVERDLVRPAGVEKSAVAVSDMASQICRQLVASGAEPPTVKELSERLACSEKELREHLNMLLRDKTVTRVSADIFYDSKVLSQIEEKLVAYLKEKGEIIPSVFREITGLSRKFMIPLLEYFDSRKLTIRIGDKRVMRGK